jgi:DNA-binding NarL/FixJ family response regulator
MGRLRVLLAEDHQTVAELLRRLLDVECDVVGVVPDGHSLIAAVDTLKPDVIVSDITMPGCDGLAATVAILSRWTGARIVFVTVRDEPPIIRKAIALGALGFVLKDDASEELLTAVRAAQAGQSYLSRSVRTDPL